MTAADLAALEARWAAMSQTDACSDVLDVLRRLRPVIEERDKYRRHLRAMVETAEQLQTSPGYTEPERRMGHNFGLMARDALGGGL